MLRPGGYAHSFDEYGLRKEVDTFTCCHCNRVVHVVPKMKMDDLGSMCRHCMKMVCAKCANFGCTPFEKKLEAVEERDRVLRSYGL